MKTVKRLVVAKVWEELEIYRQGTEDVQGGEVTLHDVIMGTCPHV